MSQTSRHEEAYILNWRDIFCGLTVYDSSGPIDLSRRARLDQIMQRKEWNVIQQQD